jgi:hypothetical protein
MQVGIEENERSIRFHDQDCFHEAEPKFWGTYSDPDCAIESANSQVGAFGAHSAAG